MDKKTILIVDDDPRIRKTLSDILGANGYAATTAATGREALDALKKQTPYVVLIDLRLEDMSGLAVMKAIKENSPDMQCIVITGYASQESTIEAINLGAFSYVRKPYDMEQLLVTIQRAVEKRETEEALRKSEERYRTLFEDSRDAIYITAREGEIIDGNQAMLDLFGYKREEMIGMKITKIYSNPNDRPKILEELEQRGSLENHEIRTKKKNGTEMDCVVTVTVKKADDGNIIGYQTIIRDISERKKLEAQFIQAQKMEAIGTLTGGIAHDFNNLLTTIIGNAHMALMELRYDDPMREEIEEIKEAGERASSLTRQLLAFSRKQLIQPQISDLNEILKDIQKMLVRMIGEDIELKLIPCSELNCVKVDPVQIEQVIMNLVTNARDAMPRGGKLVIETSNVDLNERYFHYHVVEGKPGSYIMLTVSDTGIGMDKKTQSHIFEPFFTTKEKDKGTGLGLSTVYGIVRQIDGFVWAYSEPGKGSTFKIYLPAVKVKEDVGRKKHEKPYLDEFDGSETVLIVEDDDGLRNLAIKILQSHGYKTLGAENGEKALKISEEIETEMHLMITDVVMPGISGKELAKRLQSLHSETKVLYMSGYTDKIIEHHGVLNSRVNFIEKPFTPEGLARKTREVLDKEIEN